MQTALVLSSRGSDILGHFRSKSDQGRLLCRAVRHWSSQLTKLSGDFGREKCRDPLYTFRHCMECRNACAMFSSSHSLEEMKVLPRSSPPHVAALPPLEAQLLM